MCVFVPFNCQTLRLRRRGLTNKRAPLFSEQLTVKSVLRQITHNAILLSIHIRPSAGGGQGIRAEPPPLGAGGHPDGAALKPFQLTERTIEVSGG